MARISDIEASPMPAEARAVFDRITAGPRGRVEGPLRIWLHRPQLANLSQALGAYCRYETSLSPRLSELAILIVGAHWRAGFEWFVHAPIAAKAGLSADAIEAIRVGRQPLLETDEERAVYDFVYALVTTGRIPDATFQRCRVVLGEGRLVDLVGVVGYYSYIAMTIVAFEVDVPPPDPFGDLPAPAWAGGL